MTNATHQLQSHELCSWRRQLANERGSKGGFDKAVRAGHRNRRKTGRGRGSPAGGTRVFAGNRSGRRGAPRLRTDTARRPEAPGVLGRSGDTKPRSETERVCVCQIRLPGTIFLVYRSSKVMRETGFRCTPGPVAAAHAPVSAVLAGGAPRGAGDGAPRAAPRGCRQNAGFRRFLGPRGVSAGKRGRAPTGAPKEEPHGHALRAWRRQLASRARANVLSGSQPTFSGARAAAS
jgi:hypothetical protein